MESRAAELERSIRAAVEALQRGDPPGALAQARAALAIDPANYDAQHIAALALLYSGRAAEALEAIDRLIAAHPRDAAAHNTRGAVLQGLGRFADAAQAYRQAVSLAPDYVDGWTNFALSMLGMGNLGEAEAAFDRAAKLQPAVRERMREPIGEIQLRKAFALLAGKDRDAALQPAREAARLLPGSAEAAGAEAQALLHRCEFDAALERFARAAELDRQPSRWRFPLAFAWPAIVDSRAEIERHAARASRALADLARDPPPLADAYREVGMNGLYMAYQGLDDTQWQRDIAQAFRRASPSLEWSAPRLSPGRPQGRKIRLGIASAYLNDHTIGKLNLGFARNLDRSRFELVVIRRHGTARGVLVPFFDECADRVIELPADLARAREVVAEARLDALFHPDVGMDPFMYFLAFARLAPVQFTTWGHPVTTGMPNMDYFLSHAKVEPADGARRYTEKLVLFENLPSYYYRPRGATEADMRERLGIAREARLYACPQTLIKFHPDFDDAVGALLRRDPRGLLLLVENGNASWNRKLQARMARTAPDLADRIRFVPAMPLPDFFALQRQADALLDTFHFGGGCSSYEALSAGAPVVTLPGASMRARVTLGWYELLGERTWVARDTEEFVELAYRLANDRDAREASRRRIGEGLGALVENDAVVRELERFVERAVEEAR
jgi:predicted O-linked N-acetylglucosamine transferase (SPINDLY family)